MVAKGKGKRVHFTKWVPRSRVFKSVIAPVQAWLLSRGKCVGCGASLSRGRREKYKKDRDKVTCGCGRVFIYNRVGEKYRRALFEEV